MFARFYSIALFLPLLASAGTPPRVSQVKPSTVFLEGMRQVDVDGDGDLDFLWGASIYHCWSENLGSFKYAEPAEMLVRRIEPQGNSRNAYPADLDGAGELKFLDINEKPLVWGAAASRTISVISASGDGTWDDRKVLRENSPSNWFPMRLDEGFPDLIVEVDADEGKVKLWRYDVATETLARWSDQEFSSAELEYWEDIQAADVNGDGMMDLCLRGVSGFSIYLRTGNDTFADISLKIPYDEYVRWKWVDLNGDGLPDLLFQGGISILNQGGAWSEVIPSLPGDEDFLDVLTLFSPGDGRPATLVVQISNEFSLGTSYLEIEYGSWKVLNESPQNQLINGGRPLEFNFMIRSDFDGDGFPDLLAFCQDTIGSGRYGGLTIARGKEGGGYLPYEWFGPPPTTDQLVVTEDFNGDELPDLLVGPDANGGLQLRLNLGGGKFSAPRVFPELMPVEMQSKGIRIEDVLATDIDGDGLRDLTLMYAKGNAYEGNLMTAYTQAIGLAAGGFELQPFPDGAFDYWTMGYRKLVSRVDWDGDGDMDVMIEGGWIENRSGTLDEGYYPLLPGGNVRNVIGQNIEVMSYSVGDLDGDGVLDVISNVSDSGSFKESTNWWERTSINDMAVGYGDGFGGINAISRIPVSLVGSNVIGQYVLYSKSVIFDVNLDGWNDLIYPVLARFDVLGAEVLKFQWRRNPGGGSRDVKNWVTLDLPGNDDGISRVVDFNGDGKVDLAIGSSFFTPSLSGPSASPEYDFTGDLMTGSLKILDIEDYDGDGDADILRGSANSGLYLERNLIIDERSGIARRMLALGVAPELVNPEEDADGDGRNNALEWLGGSDPTIADAERNRADPVIARGANGMEITFEKRADSAALDMSYELEQSSDLRNWRPFSGANSGSIPLGDGWLRETFVTDPTEGGMFFRVKSKHEIAVGR